MIRPNQLSNPGENAALARVEAVVSRLDAAPIERIVLSRRSLLDPETHARLMARLEAEAERCGRRGFLEEVREHVRVTLVHRFSPLSALTGIGFPNPVNAAARPGDEAVLMTVIMDAVAVAVMEDRLDPRSAQQLAGPGRDLLGLPPLDSGRPLRHVAGAREPTAADWAEAATGDARAGGYSPVPVTARIVVATVTACIFGPLAVVAGVVGGSTLVGIVAGLAVVALCWLLATYGR